MINWYDSFRVTVPEGTSSDVTIRRFEVERDSLTNLRLQLQGGRQCAPGTYTQLLRRGQIWMSDTTAECRDHWEPYNQAQKLEHGSMLINGLGLGVLLQGVIPLGNLDVIDVVEIDPDVIKLVGDHYMALAEEHGVQLTIHQDDAYTIQWPKGRRWDLAWHDIWPTLCTDDLEEHGKLNRKYGRRVDWQGCWAHEQLLSYRRRERATGWCF